MLIIYSTRKNKRIEYIVSHIFQVIIGTDCVLTDEKAVFLESTAFGINYSGEDLGRGIWIQPHSLLYEQDVRPQTIRMGSWQGLPCFFLQEQGDIPFDLFAASFYLLTRYEEYTCRESDQHGRFPAESSLAWREGFLEIPLVDRWVHCLKELLRERGGPFDCFPRSFRLVSTFDIDHPYLYLNKGGLKNALGALKELLRRDLDSLSERIQVLLHLKPDPYLEAFRAIVERYKVDEKDFFAFIHVGPYGKFDRRTLYPHRRFYSCLRSLYDVRWGLHPSYKASFDQKQVQQEKTKLEKILGHDVKRNRQHFLRMRVPETYRLLHALRFEEDFTLAYASRPGFRASTSIPFLFFDVERNEVLDLLIRPTIVMDATFITYLACSPEEASAKMRQLMQECCHVGGDFTMLWHNSSLCHKEKNPWYKVFLDCLHEGMRLEKNLMPD